MVTQFGVKRDVDGEELGELLLLLANPITAVLVVLAADRIGTAEKCPSNATIPTVIHAYFVTLNDVASWTSCHRNTLLISIPRINTVRAS